MGLAAMRVPFTCDRLEKLNSKKGEVIAKIYITPGLLCSNHNFISFNGGLWRFLHLAI
jgi:hypothetical protein